MNQKLKNQNGIAHPLVLVAVVGAVLIIGFVGYRVSQSGKTRSNQTSVAPQKKTKIKPIDSTVTEAKKTPKDEKSAIAGTFVQQNNVAWPAGQKEGYVGLNAGNAAASDVSKVEWYLVNTATSDLRHTADSSSVGNLFQYNWSLEGLPAGTYRWVVRVYDTNGKFSFALNNEGNPYLDQMITQVETLGTVAGTFVQQNDITWPRGQREIYIGLNAGNGMDVSKVEWYINSLEADALAHSVTRPAAGNLYQFNWNVQGLASGKYRVQVKVYDTNGNYQLVKNNNGNTYLDTNIVN
ncbi:hypothetical protein EKI60_01770 [Candidatus Saccharibacteria bacterium]|nr:MAG: hypothetical protein EKI60_01770 [Candidatus Saccharibacteria bacterium]